ncbi:hypothetical protein G6F63_016053 [Rhizopus arrhizus]|uniref:Uncharacterized protein n=1 Tax=Rhizopus oryzae TaxID=64495 RepID=A0A9P6WQW1_RHIOR|nr:hypothetical protein G6F64_015606 [Rhizopus arrhizus]KAG1316434.1 hypothetical protein G6F63_016053 [Rhizopus arrhizus]
MGRPAHARRGRIQLAGVGAGVGQQFGQRLGRHLRVDDQYAGHRADHRDGREVLDDVVRRGLIERRGDCAAERAHQ